MKNMKYTFINEFFKLTFKLFWVEKVNEFTLLLYFHTSTKMMVLKRGSNYFVSWVWYPDRRSFVL